MKVEQYASEEIQALADAAAKIATKGAMLYLEKHNLRASNEVLSACLQASIKLNLPLALADAKEAFELNMHQVGVASFKATLTQAGIDAACECGMP